MSLEKLNPTQVAQLGGFGRAKAMTPEERSRSATIASLANLEKNGREQTIRAAHARWGRLKKTRKTTKENAPRGGEALSHTEGV